MKTLKSGLLAIALLVGIFATPVAVAQDGERPLVVVTTEVLGSVVADLVGDAAEVTTLMAGGVDPHSWQPSARDSQALFAADLIVANGLDLEEGLVGVLEQAALDGVEVFHATDHITVRDADDLDHDDDDDHEHAAGDPHFWLDPIAMRDVVIALGPVLAGAGIDIADRGAMMAAALETLDAELEGSLASIPVERRRLVTGHSALGYLADRYELQVIGTVVPGLSSSDEPSARAIADLVQEVRDAAATAVFTDVGTPQPVAEAVASETGAQIVELRVAQLPDGGGYADLMRSLVGSIVAVLASPAPAG